jgi:hypothetical protein
MAPFALSGTSLKFDNENKTINPNLYVGFGGGRRGLALVRAERLRGVPRLAPKFPKRCRGSVLKSAFEGRLG